MGVLKLSGTVSTRRRRAGASVDRRRRVGLTRSVGLGAIDADRALERAAS